MCYGVIEKPEIIRIGNKEYPFKGYPLSSYLVDKGYKLSDWRKVYEVDDIDKVSDNRKVVTGLPNGVFPRGILPRGREYQGTWELKNNELHLIDFSSELVLKELDSSSREQNHVNMNFLFPDVSSVKADWFTGSIMIQKVDIVANCGSCDNCEFLVGDLLCQKYEDIVEVAIEQGNIVKIADVHKDTNNKIIIAGISFDINDKFERIRLKDNFDFGIEVDYVTIELKQDGYIVGAVANGKKVKLKPPYPKPKEQECSNEDELVKSIICQGIFCAFIYIGDEDLLIPIWLRSNEWGESGKYEINANRTIFEKEQSVNLTLEQVVEMAERYESFCQTIISDDHIAKLQQTKAEKRDIKRIIKNLASNPFYRVKQKRATNISENNQKVSISHIEKHQQPTLFNSYKLADEKYAQKDFAGALEEYNKAIPYDGNNPILYISKAMVYHQIGNDKLVLECLNKAIAVDESCAHAYINRALYHRHQKNYKEAQKDFEKAMSFEPAKLTIVLFNEEDIFKYAEIAEIATPEDNVFDFQPQEGSLFFNIWLKAYKQDERDTNLDVGINDMPYFFISRLYPKAIYNQKLMKFQYWLAKQIFKFKTNVLRMKIKPLH